MSRAVLAALAAALVLVLAAPAAARQPLVVPTPDGPGPSRFDRVEVTRLGPSAARTVLVLVPGTGGGAGDFTLVARDLVRRVPGLQVWAVDRRSQALASPGGVGGPGTATSTGSR